MEIILFKVVLILLFLLLILFCFLKLILINFCHEGTKCTKDSQSSLGSWLLILFSPLLHWFNINHIHFIRGQINSGNTFQIILGNFFVIAQLRIDAVIIAKIIFLFT